VSRPFAGSSWFVYGCAAVWLAAVSCGMWALMLYAATPGDPGGPPVSWPAHSAVPPPANRPVLILMAHPRCPCTRASLTELGRLMTETLGRLDARVVFFAPAGAAEDWWKTDLWATASSISGVEVVLDPDGAESRRFRTATSGHALLYDERGQLLFSGGITAARGHGGDNAGFGAIVALVAGETADRHSTPVFGCALRDWAADASGTEGAWKR
jgi:hypothetical protein